MDDQQLQGLVGNVQGVADRLSLEGRYLDAALVAGAIQAIRALRTRLGLVEKKPALAVVPPEPEAEPVAGDG